MLSVHLRDADANKLALQEGLDEKVAKAREQCAIVCEAAEKSANSLVSQCYALQREIEAETRAVQEVANECALHATMLKRGLDASQDALKQLGDVANWTAALEQSATDVHALAKQILATRASLS